METNLVPGSSFKHFTAKQPITEISYLLSNPIKFSPGNFKAKKNRSNNKLSQEMINDNIRNPYLVAPFKYCSTR
jgi:hypothetical protein